MNPLPTRNSTLPLRRTGFRSLAEALDYTAQGETGASFFDARGRLLSTLPWREVRERAVVVARKLVGAGFKRGERLLITADTWPGFFEIFFGCQYAGLLPVPVSIPVGLGGKGAYVEQLRRQLGASGAVAAIGIDDLTGFIAEAAGDFPAVRLHGGTDAIAALPEKQVDLQPLGAGERCYIQFSSGSTRNPSGVDITQNAIVANLEAMTGIGLQVEQEDHCVSWLPLYHDMGLIGFLLGAMYSQRSVDYLTPRDFARRPMQWLNLISQRRGTIAFSPSFGYELASRRGGNQVPDGLDLSCWTRAGIGGDMIRADVLTRFTETFAPSGFSEKAFVPSYGMAEVCLVVTFSPQGRGLATDTVDRKALTENERAVPAADPADASKSRRFVLCGHTIPNHRLEVRGAGDTPLADREVGRIFIKGPSVMPGYFNAPDETAHVLSADGWLDTGDLGYRLGEDVVVTGRAKDLIIVNGRNIWPQDIEWAVEGTDVVKRGDCAAFSIDAGDGERVIVAVVARVARGEAREALARDVAGAVRSAIAVDCEVVLVPPAVGLPMTSSGKLSRARTRAAFLAGQYEKPPTPEAA
jgi:fatty-acyl-CoA synthase